MDQTESEKLMKWFFEYTDQYIAADPANQEAYELKRAHSLRVRDNCWAIGITLRLNEQEMAVARAIGLVHDVGRFEQFRRYNTFSDAKSENHAELGAAVLRAGGVLSDFTKDIQALILKAVSCHNRMKLPEGESQRVTLFCRLIRDADKLDILQVLTSYFESRRKTGFMELDLPDEPVYSKEILDDLFKREPGDMRKVRTLNDFKLLQLGWVYDLNFPFTAKVIAEKHYVKRIRKTMPGSDEIDRLLPRLNAHLRALGNKPGRNIQAAPELD